jgi:hypothetical protein
LGYALRQVSDQSILFHKLYQLSLIVREQEAANELRDAKLLNDLQQIYFDVQIAFGLVEDLFSAGLFGLSVAATAFKPTATRVDPPHKPVMKSVRVEVAEETSRGYRLFDLYLVLIHVLVEFVRNLSRLAIPFLLAIFPRVELLDERFIDGKALVGTEDKVGCFCSHTNETTEQKESGRYRISSNPSN